MSSSRRCAWLALALGCGACEQVIGLDSVHPRDDSSAEDNVVVMIERTTGGDGEVMAKTGALRCAGDTCSMRAEPGAPLDLRALPASGLFRGWSGDCAGTRRVCTVTPPASGRTSVTARFEGTSFNQMFVTSASFTGDFGTRERANALCATAAASAGMKGDFRALVSFGSESGIVPFLAYRGFIRVDGEPFLDAMSPGELGNTFNWPWLDENGEVVPVSEGVATGIEQSGDVATTPPCANWTSKAGVVRLGNPHSGGRAWLSSIDGDCSKVHLYCADVTKNSAADKIVVTPPVSARRVFIAPVGGMGITYFDSRCDEDSRTPSGTFVAFIGTSARSAVDRIGGLLPSDIFVRPDGVVVARGGELAEAWRSGIWQRFDGTYVTLPAWFGGPPGVPTKSDCDGSCSCDDWGATTRIGIVRLPEIAEPTYAKNTCDTKPSVICVEKRK